MIFFFLRLTMRAHKMNNPNKTWKRFFNLSKTQKSKQTTRLFFQSFEKTQKSKQTTRLEEDGHIHQEKTKTCKPMWRIYNQNYKNIYSFLLWFLLTNFFLFSGGWGKRVITSRILGANVDKWTSLRCWQRWCRISVAVEAQSVSPPAHVFHARQNTHTPSGCDNTTWNKIIELNTPN